MGDFNFKEINWDSNTTNSITENIAYSFLDMCNDLYQHVNQPTRFRGNDEPSILDLVFTDEEGMIDNINHQSPLGMIDHEVLEFKVVLEGKLINTIKNKGHLCNQHDKK